LHFSLKIIIVRKFRPKLIHLIGFQKKDELIRRTHEKMAHWQALLQDIKDENFSMLFDALAVYEDDCRRQQGPILRNFVSAKKHLFGSIFILQFWTIYSKKNRWTFQYYFSVL
jgi:hypothetical protein